MISAIFLDEVSIQDMVVTTCATTEPPCDATSAAPMANLFAWRACPAFCLTVEVSPSIEAAVSSRLACCVNALAGRFA
ncbi:hypothetical protein ADT25_21745 [Xanthomonas oryzae]|uniref:Uncharacterized protein n=1 Tax=Xanthomonas oryzae TaxID=347 RepID=A0AAP1EUY3_9XANT|nr:hypothetical protein ADT25_21745 [Xanthomonas oryzae]